MIPNQDETGLQRPHESQWQAGFWHCMMNHLENHAESPNTKVFLFLKIVAHRQLHFTTH